MLLSILARWYLRLALVTSSCFSIYLQILDPSYFRRVKFGCSVRTGQNKDRFPLKFFLSPLDFENFQPHIQNDSYVIHDSEVYFQWKTSQNCF